MKYTKTILSTFLISAMFLFVGSSLAFMPSAVYAQPAPPAPADEPPSDEPPSDETPSDESPAGSSSAKDAVCQGVQLTGGSCEEEPDGATVQSTITTIVNLLSFVVGVIAVIMVIIGGLKYVTSGGDSTSTNNAKNTILYALIGLVIVAIAQVLVIFVVDRVT